MGSIEYYDRVKKSFGICGDNPPFFAFLKIKNFPLSLLVNSEPNIYVGSDAEFWH